MVSILVVILALSFIYFSEKYSRSAGDAKRFRVDGKWQYHTLLYFLLALLAIILTPILLFLNIGFFAGNSVIFGLGILLLVLGVAVRIIAMKTLGKYHTRSLITIPNQTIIKVGIYKYIRHPGYLGTILAGIGFALATTNGILITYVVTALIVLLTLRIRAEEEMMVKEFGLKYKDYANSTKRLIPFIF